MTARAFNTEAAFLGDQQQMELIFNLKEQQTALFLLLRPATAPGCPVHAGLLLPLGLGYQVHLQKASPCLGGAKLPHMLRPGPGRDPGWTREDPQTCLICPTSPLPCLWLLDRWRRSVPKPSASSCPWGSVPGRRTAAWAFGGFG